MLPRLSAHGCTPAPSLWSIGTTQTCSPHFPLSPSAPQPTALAPLLTTGLWKQPGAALASNSWPRATARADFPLSSVLVGASPKSHSFAAVSPSIASSSTGTGCPERWWSLLLGDAQKPPRGGPVHPAPGGPGGPLPPQPCCGSEMRSFAQCKGYVLLLAGMMYRGNRVPQRAEQSSR